MMNLHYKTISHDPLTPSGVWRGTQELDDKLNRLASEGWVVQMQWANHDGGTWYFLMIQEAFDL